LCVFRGKQPGTICHSGPSTFMSVQRRPIHPALSGCATVLLRQKFRLGRTICMLRFPSSVQILSLLPPTQLRSIPLSVEQCHCCIGTFFKLLCFLLSIYHSKTRYSSLLSSLLDHIGTIQFADRAQQINNWSAYRVQSHRFTCCSVWSE